MRDEAPSSLGAPRWRGQPGRTEVWYATATGADGTGLWIHHETVAPTDGGAAHGHGWVAVFAPSGPPIVERFGPAPVEPVGAEWWQEAAGCRIGPGTMEGEAGTVTWALSFTDGSAPLYTFPRATWRRPLLPASQIVPWPAATVTGTVTIGSEQTAFDGRGAVARIYGHGNAQRWGWLHADLDGEGTLEVVTATARRPLMRPLPPLALLQLRLPGQADWPRNPLLAAPRLRTSLDADGFTVHGRIGRRSVRVEVGFARADAVALTYVDPDGAEATCVNSERATATIEVVDAHGDRRRWHLDRTAHAERGDRPPISG